MCITLDSFWSMDTYTLYEFLTKEYDLIEDERKEQAKLDKKNHGMVEPKHENSPEMEAVFGDG